MNGLPDAPPELAEVTEVPDVPPSAEFETNVPAVGVTTLDGADAGPVPTLLVAVTVKVYVTPSVSVTTEADVAPAVVAVTPPGDAVTVYMVIVLPPLDAGAVQLTVAWPLPGTAVTAVGAPGAVPAAVGVTGVDAADDGPVPMALVAVTVNVYAVPLVSPVTSTDVPLAGVVTPPGDLVTV